MGLGSPLGNAGGEISLAQNSSAGLRAEVQPDFAATGRGCMLMLRFQRASQEN
jgi:hypothetical protein